MMRWSFLIACGCNQALGLQATELADTRPTPICPAIGSLPTFYGDLHQLAALKLCSFYTPSYDSNTASALCADQLMIGALDQPLSPVTLHPMPPIIHRGPRLVPEGNRLFLPVYDAGTMKYQIAEYVEADGVWTSVGAPYPYADVLVDFSAPSRAPENHLVYVSSDQTLGLVLVELVNRGAGWIETTRYPWSELGVTRLNYPNLSADGLRLVFISDYTDPVENQNISGAAFYTDRATTSDRFGMARPIAIAPHNIQTPYLAPDCGKLYFSALGTVFYMQ